MPLGVCLCGGTDCLGTVCISIIMPGQLKYAAVLAHVGLLYGGCVPPLGRQILFATCFSGWFNAWWQNTKQEINTILFSRPELRQDYPLNLSISLSGGKETNKDSPSNGERTGNSPT